MKIVHERAFSDALLENYSDTPFFRLYHPLRDVKRHVSSYEIHTVTEKDLEAVLSIINRSYPGIQITREEMDAAYHSPCARPVPWALGNA